MYVFVAKTFQKFRTICYSVRKYWSLTLFLKCMTGEYIIIINTTLVFTIVGTEWVKNASVCQKKMLYSNIWNKILFFPPFWSPSLAFGFQTGNVGTNTTPDLPPPAVVTTTDEMLPAGESVKKREMISYQTPDGSINNKLPPINGNGLPLLLRPITWLYRWSFGGFLSFCLPFPCCRLCTLGVCVYVCVCV